MRPQRMLLFALVLAAALASLGMTGGSERTSAVGYNLKPVSDTEKWFRTWVVGNDSFDAFAVQGVDFTITSVKSVRASGAATPTCAVSGNPATLRCDGHGPTGASVFVNFSVSGSGGMFKFARANAGENLDLVAPPPSPQGPPLLPITAKLTGSTGSSSKTVTFSGQNGFDAIEVMPYGFRITNVTKSSPAASCKPEGTGIDCSFHLAKGTTGAITFDTAPAASRSTAASRDGENAADVLLHGDDGTGDKYVVETKATKKYNLYWVIEPAHRVYRVGDELPAEWVAVLKVKNADNADRESMPATAEVRLEGGRADFSSNLKCYHAKAHVPALTPHREYPVCWLGFGHYPVTADAPGTVTVVARVTCFPQLEPCPDNTGRATIVVQRKRKR